MTGFSLSDQIDVLRDQFESDLKSGKPTRIEDLLAGWSAANCCGNYRRWKSTSAAAARTTRRRRDTPTTHPVSFVIGVME